MQHRITMLLGLMTLALMGLLLLVEHGWRRRVDLLVRERLEVAGRVSQRILDVRASDARVHADDYTRWDDFVEFVHKVNPRWGDAHLTQSIATFGVDVAWVLNKRFNLVFTANPSESPELAPLPVPARTLAAALRARPIRHFFVLSSQGLIEVWTSPIQPSVDQERKAPIHGHYIIARVWTEERMKELARVADARVILSLGPGPYPAPSVSPETGQTSIAVPLPGLDGSPVAAVGFKTVSPLVSRDYQITILSSLVLLGGVLLIVLAVGWALRHWIGRPLASITEAIRRREPGLLRRSLQRPDELGQLARLVEDSLAQREKPMEPGVPAHAAVRAKVRPGRMTFSFEEVALEEIVANAVEEFASVYDENAVKVEVRADGPLVPVCADRRTIRQVLRNLLYNAAKASKRGGTVTVRLGTSGGLARVAVEDVGVGIPEGEVELFFDNLVQASHTGDRPGWTGLGPAICREIVEGHEGRIWAENRAEGGARITFQLPIAGPAAARKQRAELEGSGAMTATQLPLEPDVRSRPGRAAA